MPCIFAVLESRRPSHPNHAGVSLSGGKGRGARSFVACLSRLTVDHTPLSWPIFVPARKEDSSSVRRA